MQKPSISSLKKKLDKVFSEFIRKRDADSDGMVACVTCGKVAHWREMQCGHFISRARTNTRWHEQNCHVQDYACNIARSGEQYLHGLYIDNRYGKGTADKLFMLSRMTRQMKEADYIWMIAEFKDKIKQLEEL